MNVVTLHKLIKVMPQGMHAVIKAKGGPSKILECVTFYFLAGQCMFNMINVTLMTD